LGLHAERRALVTPAPRYGTVAVILHWTIAVLVVVQLCGGLLMTRYAEDLALKFRLYQFHKSLGATILMLMALRLAWRLMVPPPPWPASLNAIERRLAVLVHAALYALLMTTPLSGWARVSAAPLAIPTLLYGVVPAPHIPFLAHLSLDEKKMLEPVLKNVHSVLGWAVLATIALHVAAAFRHTMLQDGIMLRMLPHKKKNSSWFSRSPVWAAGVGVTALLALQPVSSSATRAVEWSVDSASSKVSFEASAGGQPVKGVFKRFTAQIDFDPEALESSKIRVAIDLSSARTGAAEVDKALPSADWFDVRQFPQATFQSSAIRALGGERYELRGDLSLRDAVRPVLIPFTLHIDDNGQAQAEGEFTVSRSDFGVGPALPAGGLTVDDAVQVMLNLNAMRMDN
jgi:cytochrome b561/polyisoprenoid-binding protein YceI